MGHVGSPPRSGQVSAGQLATGQPTEELPLAIDTRRALGNPRAQLAQKAVTPAQFPAASTRPAAATERVARCGPREGGGHAGGLRPSVCGETRTQSGGGQWRTYRKKILPALRALFCLTVALLSLPLAVVLLGPRPSAHSPLAFSPRLSDHGDHAMLVHTVYVQRRPATATRATPTLLRSEAMAKATHARTHSRVTKVSHTHTLA